jgi:uncharacterized protein YfiM (DUF2279 family)
VATRAVKIRGDGVAAWCCARILSKSGFDVTVERPEARADVSRRPSILVNPPAERLLGELSEMPGLFADAPRIRRRTVAWGPGAEPATLDHTAAIVNEQDLLDRLWPLIPESRSPSEWTIEASGRSGPEMLPFGTRIARVVEVQLPHARETCWIESFDNGWLFLIAGNGATGSLVALGASPEELLDRSRSIAPEIASVGPESGKFPAYPRIVSPMFGDRWLVCGSASMGLDPVCGDGCGHAIREAMLAAAVLRGGCQPGMLEHYQARLRLAFERHLGLCRTFYAAGNSGPWWTRELELVDQGLAWLQAAGPHEWRYRLDGFDLVPLAV